MKFDIERENFKHFLEEFKDHIPCYKRFTKGEKSVFLLLLCGFKQKEIRFKLQISQNGVNWHAYNIFKKLKKYLYPLEESNYVNKCLMRVILHKFYLSVLKSYKD